MVLRRFKATRQTVNCSLVSPLGFEPTCDFKPHGLAALATHKPWDGAARIEAWKSLRGYDLRLGFTMLVYGSVETRLMTVKYPGI